MRSLYEKLNRLDDSLTESKRIAKKKKLTESTELKYTFKPTELQKAKAEVFKLNGMQRFKEDETLPQIFALYKELHPEGKTEPEDNSYLGRKQAGWDFLDFYREFQELRRNREVYVSHHDTQPNAAEIQIKNSNTLNKLTESFEDEKKKLLDAAESVKCKLDDDTIEYAMHDVDDFIENELVFAGNMLLEEHPEMLFWKYGDDSDNNFGGYFEIYESDEEYPDAYYQIVHDRLYDITDEVDGDYDYDDDIDEMLTESEEKYDLSTLVKDSINHLVNDLGKDPMADDFGDDVCADLEDNYDIDVPQNPVKYADWCDAVMCEVSRQLNRKELTEGNNVSSQLPPAIDSFLQDIAQMYQTIDYRDIMQHEYSEEDIRRLKNLRRRFRAEVAYEGDEETDEILQDIAEKVAKIVKNNRITENRWNPYFTPYGYQDATKVLNGKAPEYYYHLKEIEMDRGDGVRLARYAMRKGLPVMVDKNSDPDYPEFAIKGEYHWNDYFYPYPTAHEEDLVEWDSKMFTGQSLREENNKTGYSYKNYTICYGYKNTDRWYVKDGNNNYVGALSGFATEEEAKEYIDNVINN